MAARIVGLDIGSSAVRLAEVELGKAPTLKAFGQVGLPPSAVIHGEIAEPGTVAEAIARLWSQLNIKRGTRVRIGISNPNVIVRILELPDSDERPFQETVREHVQQMFLAPGQLVTYDAQPLDMVTGTDGTSRIRVLVAAAHTSSVQSMIEVANQAGMNVVAVDPAPLALVRALDSRSPGTQLIVSIGAGITMVVVDQSGIPQFVRTVPFGGRSIDAGIAAAGNISMEAAESLRRSGTAGMSGSAAEDIALAQLVETVRTSLAAYMEHSGGAEPTEMVLTGGMSRDSRLTERLAAVMGLPLRVASPRSSVSAAELGFSGEDLEDVDAVLAVPLGLALGALSGDRAINLGRELLNPERPPSRAGVIAAAVLGVGILAGVGYLTHNRIQERDRAAAKLEAAEERNAVLRARIAANQPAEDLSAAIARRRSSIEPILAEDVAWSRVLEDLRATIPPNVWLQEFQGTSSTALDGNPGIGHVTFKAKSFGFLDLRDWLRATETSPLLSKVKIDSAKTSDTASEELDFSSNAIVESDGLSCRLDAIDDPEVCP